MTTDRIGKLLGLLGSDQDGEALAALRALQRELTGLGLSFVDVGQSIRDAVALKNQVTPPDFMATWAAEKAAAKLHAKRSSKSQRRLDPILRNLMMLPETWAEVAMSPRHSADAFFHIGQAYGHDAPGRTVLGPLPKDFFEIADAFQKARPPLGMMRLLDPDDIVIVDRVLADLRRHIDPLEAQDKQRRDELAADARALKAKRARMMRERFTPPTKRNPKP